MRPVPHIRVYSRGFSLVELMVAMVIALIVLGSVGALYLSSSQTARFQAAVQRVNENGRFAVDMISRSVRMAGYYTTDASPLQGTGTDWLEGTTGSSGISESRSKIVLKSTGDTLAARYQGGEAADGSDILDCLGNPVTSTATTVVNQYALTTDSELVCITGTTAVGASASDVTVAEGVEDMLIFYGIDTDSPGDGYANQYVNAGSVGTDWNKVVSMRISLLMNSVTPALIIPDTICLSCVQFAGTNDRLIRAEFQSTIGIRNYIPE